MSNTTTRLVAAGPRSAWPRRLLLAGLALFTIVWALPIVLAYTPFVGWVEQQLAARTGCTVRIGGLSLGWFSAVKASDVELLNAAGQPLLRAGTVESKRTLLGLVLHRDDPGSFRVEKAVLEIIVAGASSNLDTALTQLTEAPADNPAEEAERAPLPPINVEVVDSCLKLTDQRSAQCWQVQSAQASIRLFHEPAVPMEARIVGVVGEAANAGSVEAAVMIRAESGVWKHGEVKAKLHNVPLELAAPLLQQVHKGARLTGPLQGHCLVAWSMDRGAITEMSVDGDFASHSCVLALPELAEKLVLEQLHLPCTVRCDGTQLDVLRAELTCDLGRICYAGCIDLSAPGWSWLDRSGHEVSGALDLVRLVDRLPKTLHVHPDLRATSGQVRLDGKSGAGDGGAIWDARLQVTNITAVRGNQPIIWQQPVVLECRARQLGRGVPLVDELHCASEFLQVDGETTDHGFQFVGDADLGKLADPLSRFVDLGPSRLAGQAHGELTVRSLAGQRFVAHGSAQVQDLFVEWIKGRPLEEELLTLQLNATGQVEPGGVQRVEAARLTMGLGDDRIQADLAEPWADVGGPDWGVWQMQLEGELAHWQKRAASSGPSLDRWQLGGAVVAQGQIRRGRRGLECPALAVAVRDFHCSGPALQISEPTLYLHTAAGIDAAGALHLRDVQVRCPSLSASAPRLRWLPGTEEISGAIKLRGNLAGLQRWVRDRRVHEAEPLAGELDGHLDLRPDADGLNAGFQFTVTDLGAGDAETALAPGVKLTGEAHLAPAQDRLLLGHLHLEGPFGLLDAQGKIANLADTWDLDLAGELHYDLGQLAPLLAQACDVDLRMAGKDTRPFTLSGPLCPASFGPGLHFSLMPSPMTVLPVQIHDLKGDAALSWQSIEALGCTVGPTDLRFCLQQGWLQLYPIDTSLNGGRLRLQPNLCLDPGPAELVLLAGPVVDKARITPALCAGALGYAVPVLGNVADAEGTISLTLDGGRIPLAAPARADIKGKLRLHDARFGPGALSRELSAVFKTPPPAIVVRDAEVAFHLVHGRVYHRDLELTFDDVTVRSSGSVGLDGSLVLLVEMPIPPRLLNSVKLSPALAKQIIRLPITGTIDEPRVDQRVIQGVTNQILRELAADALRRELEQKLKSR